MDKVCFHCGATLPDVTAGGVVKCQFCGNDAQPEPPPPPGEMPRIDRAPGAAERALAEQVAYEALAEIERREQAQRETDWLVLRWTVIAGGVFLLGLACWMAFFR